MSRPIRRAGLGVAGVAAVTAALAAPLAVPAVAAPAVHTVATGLAGPLGLAVADDGRIYVAEAGAGRISRVTGSGGVRAVAGGPGLVAGVDITGPGTLTWTLSREPEAGAVPTVDDFLVMRGSGDLQRVLARTLVHETAANPDRRNRYGFRGLSNACAAQLPDDVPTPYRGVVESNPYAVAVAGRARFVADAAANAIWRVAPNGAVTTAAVLPPVPNLVTADVAAAFGLPSCAVGATYDGEFVPTDVEVGPGGFLYVSSLPGGPGLPGTGSVWKVAPWNGTATKVADGFTGAVDLAVAANGTVYVAELFGNRISRVAPGGRVSTVVTLPEPGAVEVAPDGSLYATTGAFGSGSVVHVG